jgi:Uma2 family endonuclease
MVAAATKPLTADAILDIEQDDENRYELIAGEIVVTASPSARHFWVAATLEQDLGVYVRKAKLGRVFAAPGVRLTEYDVVLPDIVFVSLERLHIVRKKWIDGAPDAIVEILSPSTRGRDLRTKFQLYARMGVREYWVVDVDAETIVVYGLTANGSYEPLEDAQGQPRSGLVPEFPLDHDAIFGDVDKHLSE